MSDWKTYKLGELINVRHGFAFKGDFFSDEPTKDILLTPGNFKIGGGFKSGKFKYYKGEYPSDYILNEGDILITMTDLSNAGDTLGYSAKIPKHTGIRYLHNQRLGLVQFKNDEIDSDFLYWVLRTQPYQYYIVGSSTGSTVKHTSPTRICSYEFSAPENKAQQTQIAAILSSLDDKIELNLQMNQTLEAMAQAIFKEWFVEFKFPKLSALGLEGLNDDRIVEQHERILQSTNLKNHNSDNGLPEGWRMGSVLEIATLLSGGTPKTDVAEYWDGGINWISAKDITANNKRFIIETEKKVTELGILKSAAKLLPQFTTIVTSRGTVGNYCILSDEMAISQSNYGLKSKSGNDFFLFILIESMIDMMKAFSYGTVFDTITTKTFSEMEIIIPSNEAIQEFEEKVRPFFLKILENQNQIRTLTQLRDTLLPKLMSGQIEIKD
jgi:type I restriction enzyme, S subunit